MVSRHAPIALLFIIAVSFAFQMAFLGDEINEIEFEIDNPQNQTEDEGFFSDWTPDSLDALAAIIGTIWGFVKTFFNFLTFNVPGAPTWVRFIVGMTINGSLAWSLVALLRGT